MMKCPTLELHENSLLTINSKVAIRLHPHRDVLVPSAGSLAGTIYAKQRVHGETLKGLQHHWRRPHEDVLWHGDRTEQQVD